MLLDLDLDTDNGIDVCRTMIEDPAITMIPIIFLTGTVDIETKVRAFDAGAVDYVTKPFDAVELRARVRAALRTKRYHDLLASRARVDGLTGLGNRSFFDERFSEELLYARRNGGSVSLILLDVDHFKGINDTFGHPFGDVVLQRIAETTRDQLRGHDVACRYGGEEFGLVLPGTDQESARRVAERIRAAIADMRLERKQERVSVTASLGVATSAAGGASSCADMIAAADAALYEAKQAGRNRVCCAPAEGEPRPDCL